MNVLNDIRSIINQTETIMFLMKSLERPICDAKDIETIEKLINERQNNLGTLITNYTSDELTPHHDVITELIEQDKLVNAQAIQLKQEMSKQVLQQKKNTKAAKTYDSL